jgi:hypothetical protein
VLLRLGSMREKSCLIILLAEKDKVLFNLLWVSVDKCRVLGDALDARKAVGMGKKYIDSYHPPVPPQH